MERLGIYIFVFFFLGLAFFERARTIGETGSLWRVLFRNFLILIFAVAGYLFIGSDFTRPGFPNDWFETAASVFRYEAPYGVTGIDHRNTLLLEVTKNCLLSGAATLIVAVGIWELKIRLWSKWLLVAIFNLLIYPGFAMAQAPSGFLKYYDFADALLIWALPACFVLGIRLPVSPLALPDEKKHDLKDIKILPGIKHRFLFSRGIGFTMVFLVLNATTLEGHSWILSKTLTLIPASFTIIFCNLLFFGLFGRNQMERYSYAPPFFAIMAALVSTQACDQYQPEQAILAGVIATFITMLYLRLAPLKIRIWDPIASVPIFMLGSFSGIVMATITSAASLFPQIAGVLMCCVWGVGSGALLVVVLQRLRIVSPDRKTPNQPREDLIDPA